ncbi:hypothetical protein Acy02nite_40790 [Actinoplanes cyaneus]|uniref:Arylsulfotransferase ASST n=1 Tax=Actinoplanes cyaneus TaxID=52696 RepID=A0A919IIQ4_9ACTN|nr:aryl-sulfate sulfotransferase [Actinoplanes cyaneus]MCW2138240.1 Arylsulfotransferase (ASST) [Actinoplanes cyaneus]GID66198.1 hypothetical protein Acy02nite_40790 [Actinoplanes cyaneus]
MPVVIEPNPGNVLSARVSVHSQVPVPVTLTARAPGHTVTVPCTGGARRDHRLALVGLRADTRYEVCAHHATTGRPLGPAMPWRSGPLPADLPTVTVRRDPGRATPGLTLFNVRRWHRATKLRPARPVELATQPMLGYLIAVDEAGQVVWYHRSELGIEDARQLPGGDLLYNYDYCAARRIDVLGRPVADWAARVATELFPLDELGRPRVPAGSVPLDADTVHHDVTLLPNGNLLFLGTELREAVDPALSMCDGTLLYNLIGDVIVEADPATGRTVREWRLLDMLDPIRRPGGRLRDGGLVTAPPGRFYRHRRHHPRDWSHANAVVLDADRNALLVSLRHHDAVLAVRYREDAGGPAGSRLWELGREGTFALASGRWFSHQHAPEVQPDGRILLYDNGVGQREPVSRAVEYRLEGDRAWQVWSHELRDGDRPVHCSRLGDANRLPGGNVLVTHGNILDDRGRLHARIVEVTPGGNVVSELRVADEQWGWCVYRAQRISSLYG